MRTLTLRSGWLSGLTATFPTLLLALPAFGAHAGAPLGDLDDEDRAALEALALYEPEIRDYALEAVTEADVLGDLVAQQRRSRDAFAALVEVYDEKTQEQLYQLTRYPTVVTEMAAGGAKSVAELERIAANYPEELREAIVATGRKHPKVIARVDALLIDQETRFEQRIIALPETKRTAFRALLGRPELMALLAENTSMAVLLGDAYDREPAQVIALLDSLNHELSERAASEARDFAAGVEADPELKHEVAGATRQYEQETGHSAYQRPIVYNTVIVRPYSWWVGYPTWYPARYSYYEPLYYWYPRAHWASAGFSHGPHFSVSFSLPAPPFWGWFFGHPIHHRHFPHVTQHVVHHYEDHYRHRRPHRFHPQAHAVRHFERHLGRTMPRGFLDDDRHRVDRFREYGSIRADWDRDHRNRSGRERASLDEGRQRNDFQHRVNADSRKYPHLDRLGKRAGWKPDRVARRDEAEARSNRRSENKGLRRNDRPDLADRGERPDRDLADRGERPDRDRVDRGERPGRGDRGVRGEPSPGIQRSDGSDRSGKRSTRGPVEATQRREPAVRERVKAPRQVAIDRANRASEGTRVDRRTRELPNRVIRSERAAPVVPDRSRADRPERATPQPPVERREKSKQRRDVGPREEGNGERIDSSSDRGNRGGGKRGEPGRGRSRSGDGKRDRRG